MSKRPKRQYRKNGRETEKVTKAKKVRAIKRGERHKAKEEAKREQ